MDSTAFSEPAAFSGPAAFSDPTGPNGTVIVLSVPW